MINIRRFYEEGFGIISGFIHAYFMRAGGGGSRSESPDRGECRYRNEKLKRSVLGQRGNAYVGHKVFLYAQIRS